MIYLVWQYHEQYELLCIYVHHGAPFCVLPVKWRCLPLTWLPRFARGAPVVNHRATAIWLALRVMNTVACAMETSFLNVYSTFFMAADEWTHPKCNFRICKHLFYIYAKFYKHISPSHYKPDIQSLKLCCRSSNGFSHSLMFKDTANCQWIQLSQYWSYRYIFFCI